MLIHRIALYYVPADSDPLAAAGKSWLDRAAPPIEGMDLPTLTAAPARYGFHATLKPPFRLRADTSLQAALAATRQLAARHRATPLPSLVITRLDSALALTLSAPCPALHALCDDAVATLDPLRAPSPPEELARRHAAGLTATQAALLDRWGYPYVMECWRFHITLTGRLDDAQVPAVQRAAAAHFAPHLATPRQLDALALCIEPSPGAPLTLHSRHRLAG